ncbi:MAG: DUF1294 domain-containing protein [Coraliomargarita sp.]|nr:DUF1294 domain-containing protein [Coraliomargarita sp.]
MSKLFALSLILPAIVVYELSGTIAWQWLLSAIAVISVITYLLYWYDKRQAKRKAWRIPESQLHLCELLGGWPAAFLAQQQFRHKTHKRSFQATYWVIVLLHQYIAIELAFNGPLKRTLTGQN